MRLLIVGPSNLGPYHLARYEQLAARGLELTVACCPMKEFHRPWRFESEQASFSLCFPYGDRATAGSLPTLLSAARRCIDAVQPDAIVSIGYNSRYLWAMALAARTAGKPTILHLIGWENERPRTWLKERVKGAVCRTLYAGALVPGTRSAEYAASLGFPQQMIFRIGNVVDNVHFGTAKPVEPRRPYFLYVGRLAPEKNVPKLIEAYRAYRSRGGTWGLELIGDGPIRGMLEALADRDIAFSGWVNYDELPTSLANASAFVLPSIIEPWGLVVNEAMAAGLPILLSRTTGCCPELCRDGINGFSFDPREVDSLVLAMQRISSLTEDALADMGKASRTMIEPYSIDIWTRAYKTAVQVVVRETD